MIDIYDLINFNSNSSCCGMPVLEGEICSECKEHCEDESEKEE